MSDNKHMVQAALAGLIALGTVTAAPVAQAASGMEKCYGIAKAHMNDCKAADHACKGQATKDRDPQSYLDVPSGLCGKIAGGSTTPHA